MRRLVKRLLFFSLGLLVMVGCSTEEAFESFSLEYVGILDGEDTETPYLYVVNLETAENRLAIFRNEIVDATTLSTGVEEFELDNVTVTDDEIVIEYDGQVETFERLSESVVRNEDNVQYQYREILVE